MSQKQSIHFSIKLVKKTRDIIKIKKGFKYTIIERIPSIKLLGVLLDLNLLWKDLTKYTESKMSKNVAILII